MKYTATPVERASAVKKIMKGMHALHKINEYECFFFLAHVTPNDVDMVYDHP